MQHKGVDVGVAYFSWIATDLVTAGRDIETGLAKLEPVPNTEQLAASTAYYSRMASSFLESLRAAGMGPISRALEIGCGTGFMTFAVAAAGVREVIGCDLELDGDGLAISRGELRNRLVPSGADVRLEQADAAELPFEDASFDLAFSFSTLEHVRQPRTVLTELRRVLRPGGFLYHGVDPWFSPSGGHALCTLDAPWGHVRVSRNELAQYLTEYRPHEAKDTMRSYDEAFQAPRLTLAQLEAAFVDSGLQLLVWNAMSSGTAQAHRPLLTAQMLIDCRSIYPPVTEADLFVDGLVVVARAA